MWHPKLNQTGNGEPPPKKPPKRQEEPADGTAPAPSVPDSAE